jgi:hypothetical protein
MPGPEIAEPATPTEKILSGIWKEVLELETVENSEGFFALGGNSLTGTLLLARINSAFSIQLTLLSLFEHPSISAMAAEVDRLQSQILMATGNDLEYALGAVESLAQPEAVPQPPQETGN